MQSKRIKKLSFTHTQLIAISFILVIAVGTVLLSLPVSHKGEGSVPFGDALFTAVSATCVTGLVVRDTFSCWSGFGQAVILCMIQIGGLGLMTVISLGFLFLTLVIVTGAIWAERAWGRYWSWDPKETWALVTWLVYVLYIHLRVTGKGSRRMLCFLLIFGFACLQMCWWGVNYLPTAQDSIHVYNR